MSPCIHYLHYYRPPAKMEKPILPATLRIGQPRVRRWVQGTVLFVTTSLLSKVEPRKFYLTLFIMCGHHYYYKQFMLELFTLLNHLKLIMTLISIIATSQFIHCFAVQYTCIFRNILLECKLKTTA